MIIDINAYKHQISSTLLGAGQWQSAIFFYPIEPDHWAKLKAWMARNRIEWRSTDEVVSTFFEFRFV